MDIFFARVAKAVDSIVLLDSNITPKTIHASLSLEVKSFVTLARLLMRLQENAKKNKLYALQTHTSMQINKYAKLALQNSHTTLQPTSARFKHQNFALKDIITMFKLVFAN